MEVSDIQAIIDDRLANFETITTGEVVRYANNLADIKPHGVRHFPDGGTEEYPVLHSVPVMRLHGANRGAGVNIRIEKGDTVLILFSRLHTGRDNLLGFHSPVCIPVAIGRDMGGNNNVRLFNGGAQVRLANGGSIDISTGGDVTVRGSSVTVEAANITLKGNVSIQGNASVSGNLGVAGGMSNGGVSVGKGHRHSGVKGGTDLSGGVV